MYFFYFGMFIVLFIFTIRVCAYLNPKLKRIKNIKKLEDIGNIDKIYRLIQYSCLFIVGDNRLNHNFCTSIQFLSGTFKWALIQQADKLKKMVRNIRKVIKFIRGPKFIKSLLKRKITMPQKKQKQNFIQFSIQVLKFFEAISKSLGEICLILFFLTDHHESLYQIGLLKSKKDTADEIGDYGLMFRMFFSIFTLLFLLINKIRRIISYRVQIEKKQTVNQILSDNIAEFLAHSCEVFLFYGLVHKQFMTKTHLGMLGVIACCLKLSKIFG